MIKVVHPAYQAFPKGGHPSFCPSGKRRLSWVRVFATEQDCQQGFVAGDLLDTHSAGYVIAVRMLGSIWNIDCRIDHLPISTAPAVEPAIIDRSAVG